MAVIDWLLDSDPWIRWQVMRDLTDTDAERSPPVSLGSASRAPAIPIAAIRVDVNTPI